MTATPFDLAQALTSDRRAFERSMAQAETLVARIQSPSDQIRLGLKMAHLVRARRDATDALVDSLRAA